ncbi:MAG: SHOCT domain-containing protein, partial [Candidatus Limnocylindrales bacterium]
PDQSFGTWTITDVLGKSVPKKAQVELTLEGGGLRMRTADGGVDHVVPASRCRYDSYETRTGYLTWGADAVWLKTRDEKAATELEAALRLRYAPMATAAREPDPDPTAPSFTKAYGAELPADAAKAMTAEAERFAALGYALVSQSWAEPDRSSQVALRVGGVIVFLFGLLFLANPFIAFAIWLVALLLFVLSSASAGRGSLLATFERRMESGAAERANVEVPQAAPEPLPSARARLLELTQLRDEGLITQEEWASKREDLLRVL